MPDLRSIASNPYSFRRRSRNDFGAEEAVYVGGRRDFEAGKISSAYARPADDVAPLEHENAPLRASEITRGHEAVVAAADDDRVVLRLQEDSPDC